MKAFFTDEVCLVEIGGSACAACHILMPAAREAAQKFNIPFYYIDESEAGELIQKWGVSSVPSLFLVRGGTPVAEAHGYQPREILEIWIEYKLQEQTDDR